MKKIFTPQSMFRVTRLVKEKPGMFLTWDPHASAGAVWHTRGSGAEAEREEHTKPRVASTVKRTRSFRQHSYIGIDVKWFRNISFCIWPFPTLQEQSFFVQFLLPVISWENHRLKLWFVIVDTSFSGHLTWDVLKDLDFLSENQLPLWLLKVGTPDEEFFFGKSWPVQLDK